MLIIDIQKNNMKSNIKGEASIVIHKTADQVWKALTTPDIIKQYFFGTDVQSDFKVGSPITWKGEWEGKPYEDKGEIREANKGQLLQFSHLSVSSGEKDLPENYRIVTIILSESNGQTKVTLTQDNNHSEADREHSEKNWKGMLDGLKKVVEGK